MCLPALSIRFYNNPDKYIASVVGILFNSNKALSLSLLLGWEAADE